MNTSFDDWKTTKWKDINVEQMDIDCKKFAKDVRSLDKEMKTWDAFVGLDNTVKNMITSLRAVSELQNPAIRDRHWQQLMQATQVPVGAARAPPRGRGAGGRSAQCSGPALREAHVDGPASCSCGLNGDRALAQRGPRTRFNALLSPPCIS